MKSHVLYTVSCDIPGEAVGEIWHWSLLGLEGLKEVKTFPSRCWSDCLNPFLQGRRTPRAHSPPLLRRLRLNWRIWNRPRTRSTNCSCGLPACRRTMRSRHRENTSLRSRQLVSVRRYGRVIQWKSRWNFTSSASSIFLVKVLRLSTEFLG